MSFHKAHKRNYRLYADQGSSKMRVTMKGIRSNLLADYDEWVHGGDEYYDCHDHDDYDDFNEEERGGEGGEKGEEPYSGAARAPMTIDLWGIQSKPAKNKQKKPRSFPRTVEAAPATIKTEQQDPLGFLLTAKPKIVRSKSFSSFSPSSAGSVANEALSPPKRRESLQHCPCPPLETDTSHGSYKLLVARCLRSLQIAPSSIVGPTPRSHLVILSERFRVATLILWSTTTRPRAIQMMGVPQEALSRFQLHLDQFSPPKLTPLTLKGYYDMSVTIHQRRQYWAKILDETLDNLGSSCPDKGVKNYQMLESVCAKAGIHTGFTLDKFDLLKVWVESMANPRLVGPSRPPQPSTAIRSGDEICPVCYDKIPDTETSCQLLQCGHSTCSSCWTAYFQSAARSGQSSVQCCVDKCNTELNVFDAAHILHEADMGTLQKLLRFELQKKVLDRPRFCTAINCDRVLVASDTEGGAQNGLNTLLCSCGNVICGECPNGTSAHPGISCKEFQRMKKAIDSGKLDAEFANIQWVIHNSRPCPKCRYPIERISGCNHVRCQQCQYYFCWECGGLGNECMAYSCRNKRGYWSEDPTYTSGAHEGMTRLVQKYRAYRQTQHRIKTLQDEMTNSSESEDLAFEIQLQQVFLWAQAASVSRTMNGSECGPLEPHVRLELLIHALALRRLVEKSKCKSLKVQDLSKIEDLHVNGLALALAIEPRKLSKRKEQAKAKRESKRSFTNLGRWGGSNHGELFHQLFADHELADLCGMSDSKFVLKAKEVMRDVLKELGASSPAAEAKANRAPGRRGKKKKKKKSKALAERAPLNQRLGRKNEPWRNGFTPEPESGSDSEDWLENNKAWRRKKRSSRWIDYRNTVVY